MAEEINRARRKAELVTRLESERAAIAHRFAGVRRGANLSLRVRESVQSSAPVWIAGAAISGWLLSRVPPRRKKIYVDRLGGRKVRRGFLAAVVIALLRLAGNLARPAVTAFITKKAADMLATAAKVQKRAIERY